MRISRLECVTPRDLYGDKVATLIANYTRATCEKALRHLLGRIIVNIGRNQESVTRESTGFFLELSKTRWKFISPGPNEYANRLKSNDGESERERERES